MSFRRKISGVLLVAFLTGPSVVRGDEPPAEQVDFGYASRYVFRGVARAGSSVQAAAEFNRGNFHGKVGTNLPFGSGETREINLNASYTWQPGKDFSLEASVGQYWFSEVPGGGAGHSFETGLVAALAPVSGLTPGLAYYHDFRFRSDTAQVSLAHSIALTKWGAFLELNFHAGWVTGDDWRPDAPGPRAHDSYGYWGGEARLPYRIGAHATVVAGLHYADAFGRSATNGPFGRSAHRNLWFTFGVNLDF